MAISLENRRLIEQQMKNLDYVYGTGLFPKPKRTVNEANRYLIISYGGTGADAMYPLKQLLKEELPPEQFKSHVRLLVVDTDKDTRYEEKQGVDASGARITEQKERFTVGEFLWLDNKPARDMIDKDLTQGIKSWANPRLINTMKTNRTFLDGSGAGSVRQVGRVLLSTNESYTNFILKVKSTIQELIQGNADPLRIFIISGIAGGTGSGIVVDATYLVRQALRELDNQGAKLSGNTTISGFIMLPPTGNSKVPERIKSGNRNGVAALKEIDHFMTIGKRNETYDHTFGTHRVVSKNAIFDSCYLLDGSQNGVIHENPREKAVEVIKDCILDMITSQSVDGVAAGGAGGVQNVAALMSDAPAFAENMVRSNSVAVAPREANYIYCAIGHGKTLIPLDLMKSYVAKAVFDKMYLLFKNCANVTDADVDAFMDVVGIPQDGSFANPFPGDQNAIRTAINNQVSACFNIDPQNPGKKGGPYYVINLLKEVVKAVEMRKTTLSGRAIATNKDIRINQYNYIISLLTKMNNELFEVYTTVLDELKMHLKETSDILCDSTKFKTYYGSSYSFTPIDFGSTDAASKIVRTYLDTMISGAHTAELCSDLVKDMLSKRHEWTQLTVKEGTPKFAASNQIREFWRVNINKIVNANLEDYLIKYYSNNPKAVWKEMNGVPDPVADQAMKAAASALVNNMWGAAGVATPLVAMHDNVLPSDGFNGHKTFLLPSRAVHLIKYVEKELKEGTNTNLRDVKVVPSTANDRISCYAQFTNIPAFMFTWASTAEPAYEDAISTATDGLHMSETSGGQQWRNFPNLVPEVIWPYIGVGYGHKREKDLNTAVHDIFARAKSYGMAKLKSLDNTSDYGYYDLTFLPADMMLDSKFLKALDGEKPGTDAWKHANAALQKEVERIAKKLFEQKKWSDLELIPEKDLVKNLESFIDMESYSLNFSETVITPDINYDGENWEDYLAGALLRTTSEYTYRVRSTILVFDALYPMIQKDQATTYLKDRFVHFAVADLFKYEEEELTYYYTDDEGVSRPLFTLDYGNDIQEKAKHYFLFQAFCEAGDSVLNALQAQYAEKTKADTGPEKVKIQKEIMGKRDTVKTAIDALVVPNKELMAASFTRDAEGYGFNPDDIRSFYKDYQRRLQYFKV